MKGKIFINDIIELWKCWASPCNCSSSGGGGGGGEGVVFENNGSRRVNITKFSERLAPRTLNVFFFLLSFLLLRSLLAHTRTLAC